jgi:hypothetical protein
VKDSEYLRVIKKAAVSFFVRTKGKSREISLRTRPCLYPYSNHLNFEMKGYKQKLKLFNENKQEPK